MKKNKSLKDSEKLSIIKEELDDFNKLVKGHRKLLEAVGKL